MNIAFLILAHTDIQQLIRLLKSLSDIGDIYLHIDKKVPKNSDFYSILKNYIGNHPEVTLLDQNIYACWGGYSLVETEQLLLKTALASAKNYERIFFLSGLDYPVMSKKEILAFIEQRKDREFVCGLNFTKHASKRRLNRIVLYHFFRDIRLPHKSPIRKAIIGGTRLSLRFIRIRRQPYLNINGKRWDIYFASQWISLTRACASYVLQQLETNKKLVKYMKTAYAPDELCIPTIIFNSPFVEKAYSTEVYNFEHQTMLHYINYTGRIWTYDENDYEKIVASKRMFVRKLVSNKSKILIDMLENRKKEQELANE